MSQFWNLFGKGQSRKGQKSPVPSDQSADTFILEPILTPSGLVDGSDDSSDVVLVDINLDDTELEEIEVPPMEVAEADDAAEVEDVEGLEEIPFVEDTEAAPEVEDVEVSDGEIENIEFFTDIEETPGGENGSELDDLINSNVVDNNEIEKLPETTATEGEVGDINNDEVALELETEVPETDEVLEIEDAASETVEVEGEVGDINNDEVALELETEIPEADEVLKIEDAASEMVEAEVEVGDINNDEITVSLEREVAETDEVLEIEDVASETVEVEGEVGDINNDEITVGLEREVAETNEVLEIEDVASETVEVEGEVGDINNDEITVGLETEIPKTDEVLEIEYAAETEEESSAEVLSTLESTKELSEIAAASPVTFESGTFTVSSTGKVGIDFLADGGYYRGELAIFSLEGMEEFEAGSPEFIKEAARRGLSSSEFGYVVINDEIEGARFSGKWPHETDFNSGEYLGVKSFKMRPGDTFGVMLVPKGTVEKVFDNPTIGGGNRPLFSMTTANPDDGFHVGQIADFDGEGNTFVMEDIRMDGKSDRDYNDIVFQVRGAKGDAVGLDEVMNADKDWRDSDIGRGLVAYTKPYVGEETVGEVEEVVSETGGELLDSLFDNPVEMGEEVVEVDEAIDEPAVVEEEVEAKVEESSSVEESPEETEVENVVLEDEPETEVEETEVENAVLENEPETEVEETDVENAVLEDEPETEVEENAVLEESPEETEVENAVLEESPETEVEETEVENAVLENEPEAKVQKAEVEEPVAIADEPEPQLQDEPVAIADKPKVEPGVEPELSVEVEDEPEVDEKPEVEPEVEVEVEDEPEVDEKPEVEPEVEVEVEDEPEVDEKPEVEPEVEVEVEDEPVATAKKPKVEPEVDDKPEVELEVEVEVEDEPVAIAKKPEVEPEVDDKPEVEPEVDDKPVATAKKPKVEPEVDDKPEVEPEVDEKPVATAEKPEVELEVEVEVEDEPEVDEKPEVEPQVEVEVEDEPVATAKKPKVEPEVDDKPEVELEVEVEVEDEPVAIAKKPEVEPEVDDKPEVEPEVDDKPVATAKKPKVEPEVDDKPEVEPEVDEKPVATAEKPEVELEVEVEVEDEPEVDEKPEVEPQVEVEVEDEPVAIAKKPDVEVEVEDEPVATVEKPEVEPEVEVEVEDEPVATAKKPEVEPEVEVEVEDKPEVDEKPEVEPEVEVEVEDKPEVNEKPEVEPEVEVEVEDEPVATVEKPEVEPEVDDEPVATVEKPDVEPEVDDELEVDDEPVATVEKPEVEPEVEVEVEDEPVATAKKPEVEPEVEVEVEDKPEVDEKPEVEPEVEVEVEDKPEVNEKPEVEPEVEVEVEDEPVATVEKPEVEPEVDDEPVATVEKPEVEPEVEVEVEDEPVATAKKPEVEPEVEVEVEDKPEVDEKPEVEPEVEVEVEDKPEVNEKPEVEPEVEVEVEDEPVATVEKPEVEPEVDDEPVATVEKPDVEPEVDDELEVDDEPVATVEKPEVEPEVEVEVEDEPVATAKKPEVEPEVEVEVEDKPEVDEKPEVEPEVDEKPEVELEVDEKPVATAEKPEVEPEVDEKPEVDSEPVATVEKPDVEPEVEPEVDDEPVATVEKPEVEPEVDEKPEVDSEPVATVEKPEVEPEVDEKPEVDSEPVATVEKPDVEPEVEPEVDDEPVATAEKPEVEPEVDEKPEVEPEVELEVDSEPVATVEKPEVEPEVDSEPVATVEKPEVEPEVNEKPEVDSEPVATVEKPDVEPEVNSEPVATAEKPEVEPEVDEKPEVDSEPVATVEKPEVEPEVDDELEVNDELEVEPEVDSEPVATVEKPDVEPEVEPEVDSEPVATVEKPEVEPEVDSEPVATAEKLEVEVEVEPEPVATAEKPEVEPEVEVEPEPVATDSPPDEPKPIQPAIEPKPLPKPAVEPKEQQPLVGVIGTGFNANNPDLDYDKITLGSDRINNDDNPLLQKGEGNEQGTHVLGIIAATNDNNTGIDGVNDKAPVWVGRANTSNWAESLIEFVDAAKDSAQPNAVVNLSLNNLSQDELTFAEKTAIQYARENNVIVVVPAGNHPEQMSAVAKAAKEFDNIVTVGASDGNNRAFYSATGEGLTLVAEGGTPSNPVISTVGETTGKMIGTPVAAAKVTGAVSKVWAANPDLNYTQVIEVLKNTATDLNTPNWDAETGAGLVNIDAATFLAKATEPQVGVVPVPEVTLTTDEPAHNIDLSKVFVGKSLTYEVVGGDSEAIALELDGSQLRLTGLQQSGLANFTIRATDAYGKVAETTIAATNYYLNPPVVATINNNLTQLTNLINSTPEGLIAALSSDEAEAPLDALMESLEQNPELVQLLANPDTLALMGIDNNSLIALNQLLYSKELAQEMGLNVSIAEALSQPDTTLLDSFLLNADEATALLPENAKQPKVGFIDFTRGNHLQQVTETFASINPQANFDSFNVRGGNWASELVKFVNEVKASGETRGIANLSFDLSQIDDIGTTTRYELTPAEQQAIQYARDNNVLLVVASGNTGGAMSALGQASQQFDNIITVGAINQFESKADYSAYGDGLTLMAPGGSWQDDSKAFVGTSRATAYASAVASLVWAANPDLSFLQVKQLLIDTAADLDVPGWDALTGAGLVNAKEAIDRAFLVEPEKAGVSEKPDVWEPFSGAGRVQTQARPASGGTEAAINQLQNTQETLLEQWQVLADLGNPPLNVEELEAQLKDKMAAAFEQYQQVSTDAAITTAQAEQWVAALTLATQHYQIEQERLQELLGRQTELKQQLAGLGQQKSALQAETQQLLDGIKAQIAKAESDWAASQAKLSNPFAGVGNSLPTNPQPWRNASAGQQQQAHNFRQQAAALAAESRHYRAVANSINPNRWQVVGYSRSVSGRRREVWGWGHNPQLVQQKNQYQWLADITGINSQVLQQLAAQTDQQAARLNQYGQFLENRNNGLAAGAISTDNPTQVLQLLQQQLAQQQALANQYSQQANTAEQRRWHSQSHADWHNSQINQWGVVGTKRKRCGKTENVYGWIHHPQHIAPRDRSQQLANQANAERHMYAQLAQQAQHQANVLAAQVRKLQERLRDWPVLKQGIEYEIGADVLRLQAHRDLLAMHEPVQEQKLETLNLQISQAEEELQRLTAEKLLAQQQLKDATEERLTATQSEVEAIQQEREAAQKDLQNFLETSGFLLPYRERLAAVEKTIEQLETDRLRVQETMQQLTIALLQAPSDALREQANHWKNYLETLAQELAWANLQKDQLAMALADSPERLAIARLIEELEAAKDTTVADDVPVQEYLDFLRGIEGSGANFLEGFDNLEERLAAATTEQAKASQALRALQDEYRHLGLEKSNLEDNLIPGKEREIEGTEGAIAQTKTTLATIEPQLPNLQASQGQKTVEVANQEAVVAATQAQIQPQVASIQNQVAAQNAQIHQLQAAVNSYHAQINQANAAAHYHEQQRVYHQNSANHWNGHIGVYNEAAYLAHNPDVAHHVWVLRWLRNGWEHYIKWGRFEGRVPNPQALANRNAHQKAANDNTRARNAHSVRAQQLTAALHSTQHQINVINQHKTSLIQQQQGLQNQLAGQRATLQQLEQELEAITQETEMLQAHIKQQQQKLEGLSELLPQQQQELAELQRQVPLLEQQLIDKYREIELTDEYLSQVQGEVKRLDARLDLLNRAGTLEREYQNKWQQWQDAAAEQAATTEALIATRKAGEGDRSLLASLQSQLNQAQTNLQQAQALQQSINDTRRDVELKKLQIGNQHLLLQSLTDRDAALAAAQRDYLSQAESSRQRIWSGSRYNAGEANAYRTYLEQASFMADQRNKAWQQRQQTQNTINQLNQQIAQQQAQIGNESWQLQNLGGIAGLQAHINNLNNSINTVNQRLQPLQIQEQQQTQALASANTLVQNLGNELVQTARLQATALRQLIGFGVLASESDVDFFLNEVEPSVTSAIEKLRERESELNARLEGAKALTTSAEQRLAETTDAVSKQALTDLVNKLQAQQNNLEELTAQNRTAADELEDLLIQAGASLEPLRQKQELEIRQKLESNDARLQALASQFDSETAAETALDADTVLAYVQLREQIRQDLTDNASNWTQQLLAGHQLTKELGNSQQNLSQSVDELIAYITGNFADPHGEYNRSEADLRDGITTLGVVENRADELDTAFTSTEDAIERIKLRVAQDAALWEEIAPIAIRYGLESEQLKEYLQMPGDVKTRRAAFLEKYPDNGTAIDLLQAATRNGSNPQWQISQQLNAPNANTLLNAPAVEGRNPLQALYNKSQAAQGSHEAKGHALLAQAAWHEQQAAYHWAHSRKAGPYWYEQRWVKKRSGKGYWQTITHIDHHWVAWQHHSQIFPRLRAQGTAHLVEANKWRLEKERLEPLKNQWIEANNAANEAHPVVKEARKIFAQLEAGRSDIPQAQTQLEFLETLLPTLQQQLEAAEVEAAAQNAKVRQEWEEYDTDSEEYRAAVADILQRRGELNTQAIETQQQIAESEKWVEGESVALSDELASTKALAANLQQERENIAAEIAELLVAGVTVGLDDLYTKDVQLEKSIQMLTNKAAVLTAEQTALTQKRTLLAAQNEVILAEQRLLDAYINDPDADTSNLEQQLLDSRAALADAQRLAEQAEAASQALTAPLQQLKTDLLAQNDQHLQAAKEHQQILKALVEATQLNANYTLQAAQKQQEVNNLEFQVLQRLQQATAAGYQEAKHLLDVAKYNDIATAAEIYYRDYSDLASDTGGKCTHGLARPEDRMLADRYYAEMLNNRELQRRAQAQADAFRRAKETAEAQMKTLQGQQETAQQLLDAINAKVAETQEQREQKEQELAIARARLDGIARIREQTEQTFIQLVTLEKLNLAQAQLEQEIAQNREAEIDAAVAARQKRDALELERKRLETQARIEQLRQLQVEDDLRQNVNQVRGSLGLETLEPTENPLQLQAQLAELLGNLEGLESEQPDLPDDVKALLAEARGDIHLALQGKEAANIQENLLSAMDGLIGQIEHYKSEIDRIDLEEQWDNQLLQTAQSDLQGASQQLLKELERSGVLAGERDIIDPLYMEVLNKVALAEQAVEMSEDLAAQSKDILEQIIKQRIAERKARKKAFWSSVLGMVSGVIGILGTIMMFIPPLAPLGIGLTAASAGINAIQSIMNGDWLGGIFGIVMAGVNALTAGMGNVLTQGTKLAIQGLQSVAASAFNGVRSMMSGDSIMGFLQILGGVAGGVTSGLSNVINQASTISQKMLLQVFNSLQSVPTMIYGGIKSIENGDWFSAISGIFNSVITLGTNFAGVFNDTAAKVFEYLGKAGNTALAIGGAIKDGGIESWLSGINSIIGMWGDDIKGLVDRLNGEPLDPTLYEDEDGKAASCSA